MRFAVPRFNGSWVALTAIMALAAMVRWQHLGNLSYEFDEAFCWKMIQYPLAEIGGRCALDNHPPGYFYLLWAWSCVFGDSAQALRSLSAALGVMTVAGAYLLVRQIEMGVNSRSRRDVDGWRPSSHSSRPHPSPLPGGEGAGCALAAAALVALSPMQVDWSQEARLGYTLGASLSVISCWLLLRALQAREPRWHAWLGYALAAAALAYTHNFGLFVVAAQALYAAGFLVVRSGEPVVSSCRPHPDPLPEGEGGFRARYVVGAFALVALLYLPWAPNFWRQRERVSMLFHTKPFSWDEVAKACYQTLAVRWEDDPPSRNVAWAATGACLLPPLAMLVWGQGGLRLIGLCVLATFDGAICASIADRNIIGARYFVFANALLLCGLPPLLLKWQDPQPGGSTDAPRSRFGLVLGGAALAATLGGMAWLCLAHGERRERFAQRPGMTAAMEYVAEVRQPDEPVVVCNPMLQITAAAHAVGAATNGDRYQRADHPHPGPLPEGEGDNRPHPGPLPEGGGEKPEIRVLGKSGDFPYFQGTAVMREEEYVSPDTLASLPTRQVWVIDAVYWITPEWKAALPQPWVQVSDVAFPEWVSESAQIIVRCYQRRPTKRT